MNEDPDLHDAGDVNGEEEQARFLAGWQWGEQENQDDVLSDEEQQIVQHYGGDEGCWWADEDEMVVSGRFVTDAIVAFGL